MLNWQVNHRSHPVPLLASKINRESCLSPSTIVARGEQAFTREDCVSLEGSSRFAPLLNRRVVRSLFVPPVRSRNACAIGRRGSLFETTIGPCASLYVMETDGPRPLRRVEGASTRRFWWQKQRVQRGGEKEVGTRRVPRAEGPEGEYSHGPAHGHRGSDDDRRSIIVWQAYIVIASAWRFDNAPSPIGLYP